MKLTLALIYINLQLCLCDVLWRKVYVEDAIANVINGFLWIDIFSPVTSIKNAGTRMCDMYGWCWLACLNDNGTFTLTEVQISPLYKNASRGLLCFTKLKPDLAFGKTITSNKEDGEAYTERQASLLSDGVNTRNTNQCFLGSIYTDPKPKKMSWFQVDLGARYQIDSIYMTTNHAAKRGMPPDYTRTKEVLVRVGDVDGNGDFDSYDFFAYYKGPAEPGETFAIKGERRIKGRFVHFLKNITSDKAFLICHLQIFSF